MVLKNWINSFIYMGQIVSLVFIYENGFGMK